MAGSLDADGTSRQREQPVRPKTLSPVEEGVSDGVRMQDSEERNRIVEEEVAKQEAEYEGKDDEAEATKI